ncbi:DegT/DnrJ/EryC1/StrS family aminotransferase [Roseicyclus sp.]|uniref:DegT/DnrJ/EryC1/StrS family aminotransferase n=1 Tax=Roseicyclus sp. TaxID=1914329 RepID=UPI00345C127E
MKKGDEIIGVAAGFPTTVNPIIQFGAVPVFVDIDIDTHNIDAEKIEEAITSKTKAIMLASLLTMPFVFAPMVAGVLVSGDRSNAAIAFVTFAVIFTTTYKIGIWVAPKLRRSVCPKSADTSKTEQQLKDHLALTHLRDSIK